MNFNGKDIPIIGSKPRALKILVCVPSHGDMKSGFAWSLARAVAHFVATPYDGEKAIEVEVIRSSILPETRTRLVSRAHKYEATHIMWFDTDMKFPKDTILRLLNHNKLVIGANYVTKEPEPRPVAYKEDDNYIGPIWTNKLSFGIEQVTFLGMGVLLTDIRVFDALALHYFMFEPQPPQFLKQCGEDGYFCSKLRDAGIEVWIDHDLSRQVAHLGDWEYTNEMAELAQQVKLEEYNELPGAVKMPEKKSVA